MNSKTRNGFAHNNALPWLFLFSVLTAISASICKHMECRVPVLIMLMLMGVAGVAAFIGEIKLFLATRRKHHLLLPVIGTAGIVVVIVIRLMK